MYTRTYPLYYLTVLPPFLLHTFPSSYCPSIAYCHPLSFPPSLPSPATLPITPPLLPSSSPFSHLFSLTSPFSHLPSLLLDITHTLPSSLLPSHPSALPLTISPFLPPLTCLPINSAGSTDGFIGRRGIDFNDDERLLYRREKSR